MRRRPIGRPIKESGIASRMAKTATFAALYASGSKAGAFQSQHNVKPTMQPYLDSLTDTGLTLPPVQRQENFRLSIPARPLKPHSIPEKNYMSQHLFLKELVFKILLKQPLNTRQHNALYHFKEAHANKELGFRAAINQEPEDAWAVFLKRRGYRGNYKHLLQGAMTIRNYGSYCVIYPQDNALRLVIAQAELQQKLQRTKGIAADLGHPNVSKYFLNIFDQKFLDSLVSSQQKVPEGSGRNERR